MKHPTVFITGTDTGVGKTVLTALLARLLRSKGHRVAAFKPVCSGGRADARTLAAALDGQLTLDEINPWYFRAAVAPVLAARREKKQVSLAEILTHARQLHARFDWLLVEGAGGLLSPLGEKVDCRDLIAALHSVPTIVGLNRLGMVNQVRLTLDALPPAAQAKATVVLMAPENPDSATRSNAALLGEFFPPERILCLPWLGYPANLELTMKNAGIRKTLGRILHLV